MAKNSFLLKDEWKNLFVDLPDESAGQLIKAAFCYHAGDDVQIDDPILSAVFGMIKTLIDENDRKYEKRCEENRKKIQKRWDTKEQGSIPDDTTVYHSIPRNTNDTDNDNDNDIKEKDVPKGTSKKKVAQKHKRGQFGNVLLTDEELQKLITEFGKDKTDKAIQFLDEYIPDKGYTSKSHYMAIRRWVLNAVDEQEQRKQKVQPVKTQNRFNNFENTVKYDYGSLEQQILNAQRARDG